MRSKEKQQRKDLGRRSAEREARETPRIVKNKSKEQEKPGGGYVNKK
ncbi:hypothetical protein GCK32_020654 [Trichostrongylus colubriformis]|uniref:Uncharacterized protein n=1 Tax=Trichostrongylus colubriformis TaxID=6319 RepID=A0AAN8FDH0_TRICO